MKNKFLLGLCSCLLIGGLSSCNLNKKWKVTFDSKGGSEVPIQEIQNGGKVTKPTDPTKDGYTFDNWYTTTECKGDAYNFDASVTKDLTLYAKWNIKAPTVKKFTVTFDTDGGSTIAAVEVEEGQKVTKPNDPAKDGVMFDDWYTTKDGNEKFNFDSAITANITIYAHWKTFGKAEFLAKYTEYRNAFMTNTTHFYSIGQFTSLTVEGTSIELNKLSVLEYSSQKGYPVCSLFYFNNEGHEVPIELEATYSPTTVESYLNSGCDGYVYDSSTGDIMAKNVKNLGDFKVNKYGYELVFGDTSITFNGEPLLTSTPVSLTYTTGSNYEIGNYQLQTSTFYAFTINSTHSLNRLYIENHWVIEYFENYMVKKGDNFISYTFQGGSEMFFTADAGTLTFILKTKYSFESKPSTVTIGVYNNN